MITELGIEYFKGFERFDTRFKQINLLVGANNSGKTSIFHALQLFWWCLDRTARETTNGITLKKTQVAEIPAIPHSSPHDLFFNQKIRMGRGPTRMRISVTTEAVDEVEFQIYSAFANNFMISGEDKELSIEQFEDLRAMRPLFIPGLVGVTVREDVARPLTVERLIREGNQSQVLRNIVNEVKKKERLDEFLEIIQPLFDVSGLEVPFDPRTDEWLTVEYEEGDNKFDLISAGSGFLQVINLIGFLLLHQPKVALIDEPDSHMHDDLQRLTFDVFRRLADEQAIQFIVSTHSSTLIDEAGLNRVLLIDNSLQAPIRLEETETASSTFADQGIDFVPSKVIEVLRTQKALFVEGKDSDYKDFLSILGQKLNPSFRMKAQRLTIFETEGLSSKWPFDAISAFERLMGVELNYVYLSDRDFLRPEDISERECRANSHVDRLFHTARRTRESYLIEPSILARLLAKKWRSANGDEPIPIDISEEGIVNFILEYAEQHSAKARSNLHIQNESYLRSDRQARTLELTQLFDQQYETPLEEGRIPLALLNSKGALASLRTHIGDEYQIHFSDREVFREFEPEEVPQDIQVVVEAISNLFS
jgi:hypothetical protein